MALAPDSGCSGATTGGTPTGIHGTNIVDVEGAAGRPDAVAEPTENTITATTDLAFVVTIADSGDSQEVGIKVTLTIQKPQGAIVKTQDDRPDQPGPERSRSRSPISARCRSPRRRRVKVDVAPVPGEHNTDNNKASTRSSSRWVRSAVNVTATGALIVAIVGVAVGAIGLGLAWWSWVKVKRVRDAQRTLLGGGRKDLVDFAVSLQGRVDDLHRVGRRGGRRASRASTAASTAPSRTPRSSATTPTRTRAATSRPRSRCSTRRAPGSS